MCIYLVISFLLNLIKKKFLILKLDNINQNAIRMEYAVRGPIVIRAGELERQLKNGEKPGNYDKIIRGNYN